jgi:hypothetical protein
MAAGVSRSEHKLTLEIRTKSVEQTLVPLVTQVNHYAPTSRIIFFRNLHLVKESTDLNQLLCTGRRRCNSVCNIEVD